MVAAAQKLLFQLPAFTRSLKLPMKPLTACLAACACDLSGARVYVDQVIAPQKMHEAPINLQNKKYPVQLAYCKR